MGIFSTNCSASKREDTQSRLLFIALLSVERHRHLCTLVDASSCSTEWFTAWGTWLPIDDTASGDTWSKPDIWILLVQFKWAEFILQLCTWQMRKDWLLQRCLKHMYTLSCCSVGISVTPQYMLRICTFFSSKSFSQDLLVNITSCYQSQFTPHFHSLHLCNYKNTAPVATIRKPSGISWVHE